MFIFSLHSKLAKPRSHFFLFIFIHSSFIAWILNMKFLSCRIHSFCVLKIGIEWDFIVLFLIFRWNLRKANKIASLRWQDEEKTFETKNKKEIANSGFDPSSIHTQNICFTIASYSLFSNTCSLLWIHVVSRVS